MPIIVGTAFAAPSVCYRTTRWCRPSRSCGRKARNRCKRHGRPEDPQLQKSYEVSMKLKTCLYQVRFAAQRGHSVLFVNGELQSCVELKRRNRWVVDFDPRNESCGPLAIWILALWPFNCYKQRSRQKEFPIDKVPFSEELWEPMVLTSKRIWRWQHSGKMYEIAVETLRLTYNTYDGSQRIKEECKSSESETKNTSKQRETSWLNFCGNAAGG